MPTYVFGKGSVALRLSRLHCLRSRIREFSLSIEAPLVELFDPPKLKWQSAVLSGRYRLNGKSSGLPERAELEALVKYGKHQILIRLLQVRLTAEANRWVSFKAMHKAKKWGEIIAFDDHTRGQAQKIINEGGHEALRGTHNYPDR